eukprot:14496541-Alexandrium_andersonii.AAC.1
MAVALSVRFLHGWPGPAGRPPEGESPPFRARCACRPRPACPPGQVWTAWPQHCADAAPAAPRHPIESAARARDGAWPSQSLPQAEAWLRSLAPGRSTPPFRPASP